MSGALAGLTVRGRAFIAAGVACAACGLLLGEPDLVRIGVLLLALALAAVVALVRTRYRLALTRTITPPRVPAGDSASVRITVQNLSRLPAGLLLFQDDVPAALGGRPRFGLTRLAPQGARTVGYDVHADVRGRFTVGPLSVRLADPFGMCELSRAFAQRDTLTVTPVVWTLPPVRLRGEWAGAGSSQLHTAASQGEDDASVREYHDGDDMRRVHWRSSARVGELMVRREEQAWESRAVLLLDTRRSAHYGSGVGSSFEWAVSAVASIGVDLTRRGYGLRLVADTGATLSAPAIGDSDVLLDALAVVDFSRSSSILPGLSAIRHGGESVLIAVVGELSATDAEMLARARYFFGAATVLLLDAPTWRLRGLTDRSSDFANPRRLLADAGWRVLAAARGDSLAELWPQAGPHRPLVGELA